MNSEFKSLSDEGIISNNQQLQNTSRKCFSPDCFWKTGAGRKVGVIRAFTCKNFSLTVFFESTRMKNSILKSLRICSKSLHHLPPKLVGGSCEAKKYFWSNHSTKHHILALTPVFCVSGNRQCRHNFWSCIQSIFQQLSQQTDSQSLPPKHVWGSQEHVKKPTDICSSLIYLPPPTTHASILVY